jgi:ubiquinone/menaquinone biosynthesis C-methylase UbiE
MTTRDTNPQAEQMGDASMARTLAFQAEAIWPQEAPLFDRYGLQGDIRILDLGCGTGQITRRLARRYPDSRIVGVDILETNLERARADSAGLDAQIRYEQGDAFALAFKDAAFDLVVCRHLSQAVPEFGLVLDEITRVLRPGGWLHLLSEDYLMLHMPDGPRQPDRFWLEHPVPFMRSIGCDARVGRHTPPLLDARGYRDIAMDYVVVDTLRVPRETFAGIIASWRDGYTAPLAEAAGRDLGEVRADFDAMIEAILTPPQYAVWQVPIASARRP